MATHESTSRSSSGEALTRQSDPTFEEVLALLRLFEDQVLALNRTALKAGAAAAAGAAEQLVCATSADRRDAAVRLGEMLAEVRQLLTPDVVDAVPNGTKLLSLLTAAESLLGRNVAAASEARVQSGVVGHAGSLWSKKQSVVVSRVADPLALISWAYGQMEQLRVLLLAAGAMGDNGGPTVPEFAESVRHTLEQSLAVLGEAGALLQTRAEGR